MLFYGERFLALKQPLYVRSSQNMKMKDIKKKNSMDASFPYKTLNKVVAKNFKPDESFCSVIFSKREKLGTVSTYYSRKLNN